MLVLVDEAVGEVGTSSCVWRVLLFWAGSSREVWLQNPEGVLLVSSVDDTKSSGGVESVPVGSLGDPWEIVLQECVICGVSVHDGI